MISQIPKLVGVYHFIGDTLFGIYRILSLITDTLDYNAYSGLCAASSILPYYLTSYLNTVNRVNLKSPISQVPKLFTIYRLLGLIGDTWDYSLYIKGYVQQVPFSHNIEQSTQAFWYRIRQIHFLWKMFKKKTTEYFLKFLFLFESTILPFNNGK